MLFPYQQYTSQLARKALGGTKSIRIESHNVDGSCCRFSCEVSTCHRTHRIYWYLVSISIIITIFISGGRFVLNRSGRCDLLKVITDCQLLYFYSNMSLRISDSTQIKYIPGALSVLDIRESVICKKESCIILFFLSIHPVVVSKRHPFRGCRAPVLY